MMRNNPQQGIQENPFLALVQHARNGGDPMQMLQQMAGSDPRAAQGLRLLQGNSEQELYRIARNMAKERGFSPEEIAKNLGLI